MRTVDLRHPYTHQVTPMLSAITTKLSILLEIQERHLLSHYLYINFRISVCVQVNMISETSETASILLSRSLLSNSCKSWHALVNPLHK
jgi:hypothetical protein